MGRKVRDEVKDLYRVMYSSRRIAREILESVYSWDSEGDRNTEKVCNGNSVE